MGHRRPHHRGALLLLGAAQLKAGDSKGRPLVDRDADHGSRARPKGGATIATFLSDRTRGLLIHKRLVTSYATKSRGDAGENQRRVEAVFAELEVTKPTNVSYIVLRLADDSFVHVSFHDHGDDELNPIGSTAAFAHFLDGHADRRAGALNQQKATLVGAYLTVID